MDTSSSKPGAAGTASAAAPLLKDLTIDNITENVIAINAGCPDPRTRFVLSRLTHHLHDFARETRLTSSEWESAVAFLTAAGQISSDVRQEFILLSDVFGLSLLVDGINHPKPRGSTEGTVLGPFHTPDAELVGPGAQISGDGDGEPMLVVCSVRDTAGRPLGGVKVDVWETDSKGFYDVQYPGREAPDGRAVLESDDEGGFHCKAIVPVPYPIPSDGPVGKLLGRLKRHPYRPAHFHFMFQKDGYDRLITALYVRNDPYERSDAVFGVKESLIVDIGTVAESDPDGTLAEKYGVSPSTRLLKYDFVLVSEKEARDLRHEKAVEAMRKQGAAHMQVIDGIPVPPVD